MKYSAIELINSLVNPFALLWLIPIFVLVVIFAFIILETTAELKVGMTGEGACLIFFLGYPLFLIILRGGVYILNLLYNALN